MSRLKRALIHRLCRVPWRLRRPLLGPPPSNDRGQVLDHDAWTLLRMAQILGEKPLSVSTPAQARADFLADVAVVMKAPPAVPRLDGLTLPGGIPARLYRASGTGGPLLVFCHGGGWVLGGLDSHDTLCRRICAEGGWSVLSVDYRLAPEHPFPAGLTDVLTAWTFACAQAADWGMDPDRIAIGGDSAGGNLSAAACLSLRADGQPLPFRQVLLYPGLDPAGTLPSRSLLGEGFLLTDERIRWFASQYAPGQLDVETVSPLRATDLRGLPPALVVTAGFDPLRDEGEHYAARLQDAGVPVTHIDAVDQIHGFLNMDGALPGADRWVQQVIQAL